MLSKRHCVTECFSALDNTTDLPSPSRNNLTVGDAVGFDGPEFVVGRMFMVGRDKFCQHKDHMKGAMSCMSQRAEAQCPDFPKEMTPGLAKVGTAFDTLCNNNQVTLQCIQQNPMLPMQCQQRAMMSLKTGTGMWNMTMGMPPTDEEKNMDMTMDSDMKEKHACFVKFLAKTCIRRELKARCDQPNIDAMDRVMTDMSSSGCVTNMDAWTSALEAGDCVGPRCNGVGSIGSSAWIGIVLPSLATLTLWLVNNM